MIKRSCPKCSNAEVFTDFKRGDVICIKCGEIIISRIIDESNEWNEYLDDDRERGEFLARADSFVMKNSIFECETSLIGGNNEVRKTLLKTQNMMESKLDKKIISNIDTLSQIGLKLKLTPGIQVSNMCLFIHLVLLNLF